MYCSCDDDSISTDRSASISFNTHTELAYQCYPDILFDDLGAHLEGAQLHYFGRDPLTGLVRASVRSPLVPTWMRTYHIEIPNELSHSASARQHLWVTAV